MLSPTFTTIPLPSRPSPQMQPLSPRSPHAGPRRSRRLLLRVALLWTFPESTVTASGARSTMSSASCERRPARDPPHGTLAATLDRPRVCPSAAGGRVSFPPVALTHPPALHHICVDVPFQFPGEWTLGPDGSGRFRFLRSSPATVHSGPPLHPSSGQGSQPLHLLVYTCVIWV